MCAWRDVTLGLWGCGATWQYPLSVAALRARRAHGRAAAHTSCGKVCARPGQVCRGCGEAEALRHLYLFIAPKTRILIGERNQSAHPLSRNLPGPTMFPSLVRWLDTLCWLAAHSSDVVELMATAHRARAAAKEASPSAVARRGVAAKGRGEGAQPFQPSCSSAILLFNHPAILLLLCPQNAMLKAENNRLRAQVCTLARSGQPGMRHARSVRVRPACTHGTHARNPTH